MIELKENKFETIIPLFREKIKRPKNSELAPWQEPKQVAGINLFPPGNNSETIEFMFLLGALNFSYWQKEGDKIYTWGINTTEDKKLIDVFALAYALADSHSRGWLKYDAEFYCNISRGQLEQIFSDRKTGTCRVPLLSWRREKIRELGRGLKEFSRDRDESPTAGSLLAHYSSIREILTGLEKYFPYSFGDPFRKLSQLMVKMLIDRREENMPPGEEFPTGSLYREATNFAGIENLLAQPDYMLPLFCMRVGLWEMEPELGNIIAQKTEIPMDHPYEREIRRRTVESVEKIAAAIEGNRGLNNCRVDSIMWQTAVEGCFPKECENCRFKKNCGAYQKINGRLNWPHHLTRTPNY